MENKDKKPRPPRAPRKKPSPLTKAGQPRKKTGVPTVKNTPDKFELLCQMIEIEGISAVKGIKRLGLSTDMFYKWLNEDENNAKKYARAAEIRSEMIFEEMLDIADKQDKDVYIDAEGKERTDHNVIHRNKLQIDTRKWYLSKMMPKRYGDRLDLTTNNESINKAQQAPIPTEQINKLIDGLDKL
jgi:hypothetical protein